MKQNTVLAAVSIGLFMALILTNLDNGKEYQNTNIPSSEESGIDPTGDSLPTFAESDIRTDSQTSKEDSSKMAMEQDEWWNDQGSTERLTEEEMVEMLESLWGPDDIADGEEILEQEAGDSEEDEEDIFMNDEDAADIILEDSEQETSKKTITRSMKASILTLDTNISDTTNQTNKAKLITRGGNEEPTVIKPQDPENLVKDDFASAPESIPEQKTKQQPQPAVIESNTKPRPAIPETLEYSTKYVDGSYSATGKYNKDDASHSFVITFVIKNDRVESFSMSSKTSHEKEKEIQNVFYNDVYPYIIGESLANIPRFSSLGRSSQVPSAFHSALTFVRSQASR